MVYSTRVVGGFYKLRRIISLSQCQDVASAEDSPNEFELIQKSKTLRFKVSDASWIRQIQSQIERCREEELLKAAQAAQPSFKAARMSMNPGGSIATSSLPLMQGLRTSELDPRTKTVVYMYVSEAKYLEYLRVAVRVLVQPLDDLAKGAGLQSAGNADAGRAKGLFESKTSTFAQLTEGTVARLRTQQQSKALQTADMGIFLRAFPQLEAVTESIVSQLEDRINRYADQPEDRHPYT